MFDDNPYAAPKAEVLSPDRHLESPGEAWREGNMLVVRKGAELPDRCLKCNAPAEGFRFSRLLSWHRPIWFVLFLISPAIYVLVYFLIRWRGRVTVGLCPRHREIRAWAIGLGWLAALVGLGSIFAISVIPDALIPLAILIGGTLMLAGLIGGVLGSQVLVTKRIDKHFIWLRNVSLLYLTQFPDWDG
jgi:hypothetical protein